MEWAIHHPECMCLGAVMGLNQLLLEIECWTMIYNTRLPLLKHILDYLKYPLYERVVGILVVMAEWRLEPRPLKKCS